MWQANVFRVGNSKMDINEILGQILLGIIVVGIIFKVLQAFFSR